MNHIIFTEHASTALKDKWKSSSITDIFVLVDSNSRKFVLDRLQLDEIPIKQIIEIPNGESNKSLEQVSFIWQILSTSGARRNSLLINVGGGMITDLGGFAASCFKRGICFWNVPTTLLAQIDASIGGKTGINFNHLKNEIGTFAMPEWVIIDNHFLPSLPQRQLWSGWAEMLKHALLSRTDHLLEILEIDLAQVADQKFLSLIKESVAVKAAIVEADPLEKGRRKTLNLGHTIGHAVESAALKKNVEIYHGEAVAYGLIAELYLSVKRYGFDVSLYEQIKKFILEKFPIATFFFEPGELYELMLHDKKNEKAGVNFTLLHAPGKTEINQYCSQGEILEALAQIKYGSCFEF